MTTTFIVVMTTYFHCCYDRGGDSDDDDDDGDDHRHNNDNDGGSGSSDGGGGGGGGGVNNYLRSWRARPLIITALRYTAFSIQCFKSSLMQRAVAVKCAEHLHPTTLGPNPSGANGSTLKLNRHWHHAASCSIMVHDAASVGHRWDIQR